MRGAILISICLILAVPAHGQALDSAVWKLGFYADVMSNATAERHRVFAGEQFRKSFIVNLANEGSFEETYDSLVWIQKVIPADSSFRVFTWQVERSDGEFDYFGLIQKESGEIIQLHDKRRLSSEYARYDANTWYGALYYGINRFKTVDGTVAYLILGYNANNGRSNIKTCDVLTFDDSGAPAFGAEVFESTSSSGQVEIKSRIIIEYNDSATGRIRFDKEMGYVVYDNIIVIDGGPEGPIMVPDGSYHAYELVGGKWRHIEKLFNQSVSEPPGEGIDREDLDIIGRKKND